MHIEKNVCDNILGTLLNIGGKSKDHVNARLDLQEIGIRKELHPSLSADGTPRNSSCNIRHDKQRERDFLQCVEEVQTAIWLCF